MSKSTQKFCHSLKLHFAYKFTVIKLLISKPIILVRYGHKQIMINLPETVDHAQLHDMIFVPIGNLTSKSNPSKLIGAEEDQLAFAGMR